MASPPPETGATGATAPTDPWAAWLAAAARPEVSAAIAGLYARLDQAVADRGPTCWLSGRCCNFDAFGHRLYVTGLEIALFLLRAPPAASAPAAAPPAPSLPREASGETLPEIEASGPCPWQRGKVCISRDVRPLGCRVFFCQHGTEDWQHALYEQYLAELGRLHERLRLPYRYMEWRAGLAEGIAASQVAAAAPADRPGAVTGPPPGAEGPTGGR